MSTKVINSIKVEREVAIKKLIDSYEEGLEALVCTDIDNMIMNRWVYMKDNIFYDSYISSCWPLFHMYNPGHFEANETKEIYRSIKEIYPSGMKWELPTFHEITETIKNTNIGTRGSYSRPKNKDNDDISYLITCEKNARRLDNDSDWGRISGTGYLIPIFRLNGKNSSKLDGKKTLELWLNNGLVPEELKEESFYLDILELCKTHKLNNLKFDRKKIHNDYKNGKLNFKFRINTVEFTEELLNSDYARAELLKYSSKILEDSNEGHWDLWDTQKKYPIEMSLDKSMVARNPISSIIDGVVGIDFGTKSTVVVYQKDSNHTLPMRVGTGDISKSIKGIHYENPTIMEFIDIKNFIETYNSIEGRPQTRIEDLVTSHSAFNNMIESPNASEFSSFFSGLKKWAGNKGLKYKIVDKNGYTEDLMPFLQLDSGLNPIEIYAYYLGLYINNMHNGIYMDYYLSFPVTYEVEIREKIKESFYKGLRKSLPQALIENKEKMKEFYVNVGASEPAAYAITALQEYGFDPENDEKNFYGIFDFGGGTTDFDFGIWREADGSKERRFDYVIEHFGAGGDKYLGGENILELLAFEVFKLNSEKLRNDRVQFTLPPECKEFPGSEILLSRSREANLNMKLLMEKLRAFWEKHEGYESNYNDGLKTDLWNIEGEKKVSYEVDCTIEMLEQLVKERIERGVKNFFESLRRAFINDKLNINNIDQINIFLAGNSSKAKVLRELFDSYVEIETQKMIENGIKISTNKVFKIFPPLGTEESYAILEKINPNFKRDSLEAPTGKTGVAYGLIESRQGSKIKIVDHNVEDDITFKYYLGEERKKKFKLVVDREGEYHQWIDFIDAGEKMFEIFYTEQPNASTNKMMIGDNGIKRERVKIDKVDENALVYIRKVSPTAIEYVVAYEEGIVNNSYLGDIKRIELG